MLRFRLGTIPVEIHFSHVLFSALVGWSLAGWRGVSPWPRDLLANPNHPERTKILVAVVVCWMLIISTSMLLQELGHAFAVKLAGGAPRVHLIGLGGVTRAEILTPFEWWKNVLITLAGPAVGLVLGITAGLVALVGGSALPEPVRYFATGAALGNLLWTAVNLMPISPLPGGQLSALLLTRLLGRPGFLVAQLLALGMAATVMLAAILIRQPFLAVLVALMVMRTVANIAAYQRGELPAGEAAHPLVAVIERAEALYRDRKLEEARLIASGLVEALDTPALLRSRAHLLLGWIALKNGEGRRALDHFSQVQGLFVPPHALAAGFSLIGDEFRAVPLWGQAAQLQPHDELIRHELAGALLRAGREADARAVPGVQLARAFIAAERVHYLRKEFERAARAAEGAFREAPTAAHAYTAACDWAQAGNLPEAMKYLSLASQNGYRDAEEAGADPDLRALRSHPDFVGWLQSLRQSTPS